MTEHTPKNNQRATIDEFGFQCAAFREDKALRRIRVPGEHDNPDGSTVLITENEFAREVLASLPDDHLYQRGDVIGELLHGVEGVKFKRATQEALRLLASEFVGFRRTTMTKDGYKERVRAVSAALMALVQDAAIRSRVFRQLRILTNYPVVLGHDFSIVQPGWNAKHETYFAVPEGLDGIGPRKLQCAAAEREAIRAELLDLVIDFPFEDDASRENYFGLLLTPLLRPSISGNVPLHVIDAPLARTGKTKLCEVVLGGIVLGSPTSAMQVGKNDEETEKRITSMLLQGINLMHIDNLGIHLDSASLASLLTAKIWSGRPLGRSEIVQVPNEVTLVASGNNISASGELARRMVPIRLIPEESNPDERTDFHHPDLEQFIAQRRRPILELLLGMIQRWAADGAPRSKLAFGGFNDWGGIVGGVLGHFGFDSWMTNRRAWIQRADSETSDLIDFCTRWESKHRIGTRVKAAELTDLIQDLAEFMSVVCCSERGQPAALGKKLKALRDRPIGPYVVRDQRHGNGTFYVLHRTEEKTS